MYHLPLWIGTLLGWLFLLYNVERLHEPINVASFVYVLTAAIAVGMVTVHPFRRLRFRWQCLSALLVYFPAKWAFGYPMLGPALPITVTELCVIGITLFLSRRVAWVVEEFRQALLELMVSNQPNRLEPFSLGQADIYRELRRARRLNRPLTMLTVSVDANEVDRRAHRFIDEIQRELVQKFVEGRVGNLLAGHIKDCDIITRDADHYVVILPDTDRAHGRLVADRIERVAKDQLGLQLCVGMASFPDEEITFTELLKSSHVQMDESDKERAPVVGEANPKPAIHSPA